MKANPTMHNNTLVSTLTSIDGVAAHITPAGEIEVHVGTGVPRLTLNPEQILNAQVVDGPTGPAAELSVSGESTAWYVTADDVAFPPDTSAMGGTSGISFTVSDLPPVVGWRDLLRVLEETEGPGNGNLDQFHAGVLSCEAVLYGAIRAGLAATETDVPSRVRAVREAYEQE
jgi:hypothetical protein